MISNKLKPLFLHFNGLNLDPRTKILLLITISTFLLGGIGQSKSTTWIIPVLSVVPFILLFMYKQNRAALIYSLLYFIAFLLSAYLLPQLTGILYFMTLSFVGVLGKFLPCLAMGKFMVSTTTVSEFIAGMQKLKVSNKITIPLSVTFRFFPTLSEEFKSINTAMKIRGIRFGKISIGKMIEYRLVPLLICTAKIGEELSAAALSRGLHPHSKRTNICQIGFNLLDILIILSCVFIFIHVLIP